ncbi:serine kinase [Pelagibacterium lacus]|uniref:Serine kinase n=1 Tax=Pelagibacterium lacus TaxID=2282655 RepID=A0A369W694_9HYPH|nr:serine kinase [Pelagibacterium lacus]
MHAVETIDGPGAIVWMRQVIERLSSAPPGGFDRRALSVAGIDLELVFDDTAMADDYCDILCHTAQSGPPSTHIFVLSRPDLIGLALPDLDQATCSPDQFQALAGAAGLRAAYPFQAQTWKFFDTARHIGVQLTASRAALPLWDATAPLRHHFHWMLDARSQRLVHAATLGHEGRGVVLFGAGGAGKSGTTLAGLSVGLKTVGDDYVALAMADACMAHPLFRVVKQDRSGLDRHPALREQTAHMDENWRGKVMFDPSDFYPDPFADQLRIGAVVLPHIAHAEHPLLRPAKAREAMLALMTSNLHQFPAEPETGMAFYARLLAKIPCFHLDLCGEARKNGLLLKRFIAAGFPQAGLRYDEALSDPIRSSRSNGRV